MILVVGVNGVGKTTTIGKLAKRLQGEGKKVMLAAGDTFPCGGDCSSFKFGVNAIILPWLRKAMVLIAHPVIFDAFESARAKGVDVLIADTGRSFT